MNNDFDFTPVRFSHLTSYAGVGAIVRDNNDMLMTLVDTRYWTDKNGICTAKNIDRISNKIKYCCAGGKTLKMPPQGEVKIKEGRAVLEGFSLPAVLFPKFALCKRCGFLHNNPWRDGGAKFATPLFCAKCKDGVLVQVTWCVASKQGYLDDVPWHNICHMNGNGNCRADFDSVYLKLTTDRNGKETVKCTRCGSQNRLKGLKIGSIGKLQPWLFLTKDEKRAFAAVEEQDVEVLEVNAPGVYFPESSSALVIPPESRRVKTSVYDKLYSNTQLVREIESVRTRLRKNGKINQLATELKCTAREVKDAIKQITDGAKENSGVEIDCQDQSILKDEYQQFSTPIEPGDNY